MSSLIAAVASSNGCLGSARDAVYAPVSGLWWAFAYTGTRTLASYSSSNGTTWVAQATYGPLTNLHLNEGRNLYVTCRAVNGIDVFYIAIVYKTGPSSVGVNFIRATAAGAALTFHTSETTIGVVVGNDGDLLFWGSGGFEFESTNRLHISNGWIAQGAGDINTERSTVDAGALEVWGSTVTFSAGLTDPSTVAESRSGYLCDLGSGNMGLIADDGAAPTSCLGLCWYFWNGSSWSGLSINRDVTGLLGATIDKNDWGAVVRTPTDVHAIYRNAAGNLVHRRWNGTSWSAGQALPALLNASGTGIALSSDGTSVYCFAIANDAQNSVVFCEWNGAWDLGWTVLEGSTATRSSLSCCRDAAQGIVVLWHEGTNLVSGFLSVLPGVYTYRPWWSWPT